MTLALKDMVVLANQWITFMFVQNVFTYTSPSFCKGFEATYIGTLSIKLEDKEIGPKYK